jgi:hypothetical protein
MESGDTGSTVFDDHFRGVSAPTWLPWIGANYATNPPDRRLLVVGESHYTDKIDAAEATQHINELIGKANYTRAVVEEALVGKAKWSTATLRRLNSVLIPGHADRAQLWSDVAFYNFVQKPVDYKRAGRPSAADFANGWPVFLNIARAIQPSECIFIGVAAAHSCAASLESEKVLRQAPTKHEKIGRCFSRRAKIQLGEKSIDITFVKHCGRYFRTGVWHGYLRRIHPELMSWLASRAQSSSSAIS